MSLPQALEEWMADPTSPRKLILKNVTLTGDPEVGVDKITCSVIDAETGENLLDLSVVGWVGLYTTYESLKEALLSEAVKRLRSVIEQERQRRAKAAAFAALQSTLPADEEAEVSLVSPPAAEETETIPEQEE